MDDLIKRDNALAAIDAFKRDFEQSWKVQFSADIKALPAIDPAAIREAALQARIEELVKERDDLNDRMTAMGTGDWSKVRLVRFENGQLDLSAGPIPVLAEYLAQMMQNGEDKHFNFMEMQIDHKSAGPMVLSLQRKVGQTPNELRKAAEAKLAKAMDEREQALNSCEQTLDERDEALAKLTKAVEALREFAKQKAAVEMSDYEYDQADIEGAYGQLIFKARAVLAELEKTE